MGREREVEVAPRNVTALCAFKPKAKTQQSSKANNKQTTDVLKEWTATRNRQTQRLSDLEPGFYPPLRGYRGKTEVKQKDRGRHALKVAVAR